MAMDVLKEAVDAAKKNNILTLVVASTSGNTASKLFDMTRGEKLKLIVVTHDEGRPETDRRFNEDIRRRLLAGNVTVYTHNPRLLFFQKVLRKIMGKFGLSAWHNHLNEVKEKYGTGIKVCHIILQMLMEGKALRDERVVAVAGKKSGADSAGIFVIKPKSKWPILEKVITINEA
ncbi:MAG TPA: hypothetical protein DCL49_02115 [Candidatus Omnitrophica bacterium]|nr:hypothetical protein [Candidatus Omnitrophota bacterium]HBG64066.1 hypothetical protein [Candidatus Omnitrophota bacterium]